MTCRWPLIHVEVDSKSQPLLYQELSWSWAALNRETAPHLDFTRVAIHHSGEVNTKPLTTEIGAPQQFPLEVLHEIHFSKPSRERQLPRVTSRWRLLEVSLVPQSSNSWCNALGYSHTLKNAISKQVCLRERDGSILICQECSPNGRALGIYSHPLKN